jgi:DNA (cytosine-5)-methyltransferase 1
MSETQQQRFTLTDELQVMPPLSDEEYAALKADISQNGVEDPIVHDEGLVVIDGHHRVRACRELGVDMDTVPTKAVVGLSDDEKREKAYKLNLQRRHLEDGQKQDIVEQYLVNDWDGDNTGEWQNELANQLGVGDGTVYRAHRDLRDAGKLIHLDIFPKGVKEQQAKDYLDEHPDASNREVADAIEADVSYRTVGNWRNEYDWGDDEDESGEEVTKDTLTIESFGRGADADDRATQSEDIVDTATDEDAPDEAKEVAQEKAEEVNRGESTPDEAKTQVDIATQTAAIDRLTEREDPTTVEYVDEPLKVLNLYAGIGGNRRLWGDDVDVTAVELDAEIADIYRDNFPEDTVIEADAHEYLPEHLDEFDFIWSSPPCPTHSQMERVNHKQGGIRYPDMSLYQEVVLLRNNAEYYDFQYCVENVVSYYEPLIQPQEVGRHYYWSNVEVAEVDTPLLRKRSSESRSERNDIGSGFDRKRHEKVLGFNLSEYDLSDSKKQKALKNCVQPEQGKAILDAVLDARGGIDD